MDIQPKRRSVAIALALAGGIFPGLHKFYLRQPGWGALYLLSSLTPVGLVSRSASMIEAVWYLSQPPETFDRAFNEGATLPTATPPVDAAQVGAIADALRALDRLRQDGLISEYEFEQKRRSLLDRIA
jgi:TM2 domain-containing membrane protein YozV